MEIRFRPIGVVHTKAGDDDVKEKGDQEGELEIFPELPKALMASKVIRICLCWCISIVCALSKLGR